LFLRRNISFQHDSVPTHLSRNVRCFFVQLTQTDGYDADQHRLARSPDLTSVDYFFFKALKNYIYQEPVNNRQKLHDKIIKTGKRIFSNNTQCQRKFVTSKIVYTNE